MDEYIKKDAVIKKIVAEQDKAMTGTEDVTYYRAIKIIRDEPSADVQPIVYAHKTINVGRRSYCSNCGQLAIMEDFCSKCGAKVKEV